MTRTSILAAAVLLTTGCAPHKIQYYQLSAFSRQPVHADSGPIMIVGHIATPQTLQDGRIRYREGSNEVGAYEYHRWTDPPGIMVRDALIHTLRASGIYKSVQESGTTAEGDYSVRGKLIEFSELDDTAIRTRVSMSLELRETKSGRLVWSQILSHDDPVPAKKVADVVQSMDRNLQSVLNEASTAIGAYVTAHPKTTR